MPSICKNTPLFVCMEESVDRIQPLFLIQFLPIQTFFCPLLSFSPISPFLENNHIITMNQYLNPEPSYPYSTPVKTHRHDSGDRPLPPPPTPCRTVTKEDNRQLNEYGSITESHGEDIIPPHLEHLGQLYASVLQYQRDTEARGTKFRLCDNPFDMPCNAGRKWNLDDFDCAYQVGTGQYGRVFLAMEYSTEYMTGLKVMDKPFIKEHQLAQQTKREFEIHSHLVHKNILRLFNIFITRHSVCAMMEFAPGNALTNIMKDKVMSEKHAANVISQLAVAVEFCHSRHVIHRDIKPENILIGWDGLLKLADFGCAFHPNFPGGMKIGLVGTPEYLAPEMVRGEEHTKAVDLWSIGCLTFELLHGKTPFFAEDVDGIYSKILENKYECGKGLSAAARAFISRLLESRPRLRMKVLAINTSAWIRNNACLDINNP